MAGQRVTPIKDEVRSCRLPGLWEHDTFLGLRGKTVCLLGNSPAISEEREILDKMKGTNIVLVGVNRIMRAITPDIIVAVDSVILNQEWNWFKHFEGAFLFWDGLHAMCRDKRYASYFDGTFERAAKLVLQQNEKNPANWYWPRKATDPLIRVGVTPAYAMQALALLGVRVLGVIGVDHDAKELARKKKGTHFYGRLPRSNGGASTLISPFQVKRVDRANMLTSFYTMMRIWGAHHGTSVVNLSPVSESPFTRYSEWPRMTARQFLEIYG